MNPKASTGARALLLALPACALQVAPPPKTEELTIAAAPQLTTSPPMLTPEALAGAWRIVTVNRVAPRSMGEDAGGRRIPSLFFSAAGYGGTSGCNFFGGSGLLEGDRYYTAPGPQTVMGCGDMTAQEDAITGLLQISPQVSLRADGTAALTGGDKSMVLRRDPTLSKGWRGVMTGRPYRLAGTNLRIRSIDGRWLTPRSQEDSRPLSFKAGQWSGRAACAMLSGSWRQDGDRIVLTEPTVTTEQLCPPAEAEIDAALGALLEARPRFAVGPNGKILIAGGGHWLVGEAERGR